MQAFALRSQIEIAVTLLIIVLFRQLGIVKETKEFTWGEIMAEEQSNKSLEKEMQELLDIVSNLPSGILAVISLAFSRDSVRVQRDPKNLRTCNGMAV